MHENKEVCKKDSFKTWFQDSLPPKSLSLALLFTPLNRKARDKDLGGNELPETSMAPLWSPVEPFVGVGNGKWTNTGRMLKSREDAKKEY